MKSKEYFFLAKLQVSDVLKLQYPLVKQQDNKFSFSIIFQQSKRETFFNKFMLLEEMHIKNFRDICSTGSSLVISSKSLTIVYHLQQL